MTFKGGKKKETEIKIVQPRTEANTLKERNGDVCAAAKTLSV